MANDTLTLAELNLQTLEVADPRQDDLDRTAPSLDSRLPMAEADGIGWQQDHGNDVVTVWIEDPAAFDDAFPGEPATHANAERLLDEILAGGHGGERLVRFEAAMERAWLWATEGGLL